MHADACTDLQNPRPVSEDSQPNAFAELGLDSRITDTLTVLGYEEPTPIQRAAIPVLLDGRDVLGQAATGTGKTAAFTLPLIQRAALGAGVVGGVVEGALTDDGADDAAMDFERHGPSVLILVPTRELAMQVAEAVHKYGKGLGVRAVPVYGGQGSAVSCARSKRGATSSSPRQAARSTTFAAKTLALDDVRAVVLDEADEMLDMGFAEDLEAILEPSSGRAPDGALLGYAAAAHSRPSPSVTCTNPARVAIAAERAAEGTMPRVRQTAYIVARAHKIRRARTHSRRRDADARVRVLPNANGSGSSSRRR